MSTPFKTFALSPNPLQDFIQPEFYYGCAIFGYGSSGYSLAYGFNEIDRDYLLRLSPVEKGSLPFPTDNCYNISLHKGRIHLQRAWEHLSILVPLEGSEQIYVKLLKFSNTSLDFLVDIYDVPTTKEDFQILLEVTKDHEWVQNLNDDFKHFLNS